MALLLPSLLLGLLAATPAPTLGVLAPTLPSGSEPEQAAIQGAMVAALERNGVKAWSLDRACDPGECCPEAHGAERLVGFGLIPVGATVVLEAELLAVDGEMLGDRVAVPMSPEEPLPRAVERLAEAVARHLGAHAGGPLEVDRTSNGAAASPYLVDRMGARVTDVVGEAMEGAPLDVDHDDGPTFAIALKIGNALPTVSTDKKLALSTLNPRLDFEASYFATPTFVPFAEASLVFAEGTDGQSLQLVPVLLGAKYLFRPGHSVRPHVGAGLGLGFLSGSLVNGSQQTTFAVHGVAGTTWFPMEHFGLTGEVSLNLGGVEVSAQSGLLLSFNVHAGVVIPF